MLILAGGLLTLDSPTDVGLPTLSCGGSVQFLRLQASLKPLRRQMLVGQSEWQEATGLEQEEKFLSSQRMV